MKVMIKSRSMSTSAGLKRNGDVLDLPQAEIEKILAFKPDAIEIIAEEKKAPAKKAPAKKKRARNANGTLKADDPSTPDVNEAYVNE